MINIVKRPEAEKEPVFVCPNCGDISSDDVTYLCNTCKTDELEFKNGTYVCPKCMDGQTENFQCRNCNSTEVKMRGVNNPKPK